jgi:tripeptide aminopeptidase
MLPAWEVPEHTENREGFYHLTACCGNVSSAKWNYILRDHDAKLLEKRQDTIRNTAEYLNKKYGQGTVTVKITESYRNMAEILAEYPFLIEKGKAAIRAAGYEPIQSPIRGGTDGARLSFMGLPCPNLGYGGYAAHGETEYADVEGMNAVVEIVLNIISSCAEENWQR